MGRLEELLKRPPNLAVLDLDTNEYTPAITWARKKWDGETFFMGFQEAFAELAKMQLGSEAKDVFLFILGCIDYDNRITVPQVEISRQRGNEETECL